MAEFLDLNLIYELLSYDKNSGALTWKKVQSRRVKVGDEAGHINAFGYRTVRVLSRSFQAHRLIWLMCYGTLPVNQIDHINGNRLDNRLANLRDVDQSVNQQNLRTAQKNNHSSGLLGAYRSGSGWCSKIVVRRNVVHLGSFKTSEQAHSAYLQAKRELHSGCTI